MTSGWGSAPGAHGNTEHVSTNPSALEGSTAA